jgi:hypothetical protein
VHGCLRGLNGERLHDLDGAGQKRTRDYRRDGVAGLLKRAVSGEHGVVTLRFGQ